MNGTIVENMTEHTPLVIIDMQEYFYDRGYFETAPDAEAFDDEWHSVVESIRHLVLLAKERKSPVIVLEYDYDSPTVDAISSVLPENYACFTKETDSGANYVCEFLHRQKRRYDAVFVTGVNRGACVSDTIDDLLDRLRKPIVAVDDAIGDEEGCDYDLAQPWT